MNRHDTVRLELEFERMISQSRELSLFKRSPTTWELLLLLALDEGGGTDGVYNTIEAVKTRYLGNSAMLKFVRERRDDGLIQFREHQKKSKWSLKLNDDLHMQLFEVLIARNQLLLARLKEDSNRYGNQATDLESYRNAIDSLKDRRG